MKISEYVKEYRKEHGLSLREMADKCSCSFQYLSKLENGQIEKPSYEMITNIASGTDKTVYELITIVDDMEAFIDKQRMIARLNAVIHHEKDLLEREHQGIYVDPKEHIRIIFAETSQEEDLIVNFRALDNDEKTAVFNMAALMAKKE